MVVVALGATVEVGEGVPATLAATGVSREAAVAFKVDEAVGVEAGAVGGAASGRNGGFCAASLTHGEANGMARWPQEYATLRRLGRENLDAIEATVERYGIECDFQRPGELTVIRL